MMEMNRLEKMDESARIWIFQSSKSLEGELGRTISTALNEFLSGWAAHGQELFSAFSIQYDRFIIIAVDEAIAGATGCSIDSMMKKIEELDGDYNLDLLNRMKVAYRSGESVLECSMSEFSHLLETGHLAESTIVFNNLLESVGDLKTKWEVPISESWHAQLMPN